jgi:hypothetical protein
LSVVFDTLVDELENNSEVEHMMKAGLVFVVARMRVNVGAG